MISGNNPDYIPPLEGQTGRAPTSDKKLLLPPSQLPKPHAHVTPSPLPPPQSLEGSASFAAKATSKSAFKAFCNFFTKAIPHFFTVILPSLWEGLSAPTQKGAVVASKTQVVVSTAQPTLSAVKKAEAEAELFELLDTIIIPNMDVLKSEIQKKSESSDYVHNLNQLKTALSHNKRICEHENALLSLCNAIGAAQIKSRSGNEANIQHWKATMATAEAKLAKFAEEKQLKQNLSKYNYQVSSSVEFDVSSVPCKFSYDTLEMLFGNLGIKIRGKQFNLDGNKLFLLGDPQLIRPGKHAPLATATAIKADTKEPTPAAPSTVAADTSKNNQKQ